MWSFEGKPILISGPLEVPGHIFDISATGGSNFSKPSEHCPNLSKFCLNQYKCVQTGLNLVCTGLNDTMEYTVPVETKSILSPNQCDLD